MQLRNGRVLGGGEPVDVYVDEGRVTAVVPAGTGPRGSAEAVDLEGRILTPGLWDEHVHFTQWTIRRSRFDLSGTTSVEDALDRVRAVLARGDHPADAIVTGYGFRDGTWPAPPTLRAIDEATGSTPVVMVAGDLHCAWLNSAAAARLDAKPDESGVLREGDWYAVGPKLAASSLPAVEAYRDAAQAAARRGIVGIVEFENTDNLTLWPERVAAGVDNLRVEASVWPHRLDDAIARGLRTGDPVEPRGLVTMGRLKVVVDGSLNTRTAFCWDPYPGAEAHALHPCGVSNVAPSELRELLVQASAHGIGGAIHAIGDRANTEVIDTFEELGIPGVIEHAQLVRAEDFARFGPLGLVASVQPEHAMDDRDVADLHWPGRTGRAFAYASLHEAGATLRFGSDAPVAVLDPWVAIAAATSRSRDDRDAWHPEQRLPLDVALAASMRGRTRVEVGDVADLAILDDDPYTASPDRLRELPVAGTLVGGRWTWRGF
ncbi:amidohydrolase [Pseudonocardia zijingensis]|uniref:Amidohydrolase family protein n=1 Tax=Pseudonocardia zijingensis TaxID=153376 RepID=A0ABP3ZJ64_9PSEU